MAPDANDSDGIYSDDPDGSDDDSSDDSSGDENGDDDVELPDERTLTAIMKLERSLEDNPASYAAHNKLVRLLRDVSRVGGSLKRRLADAREAMSARFPLHEAQWREWISDEVVATRGKGGSRRAKVVGGLFERAVGDYLSVPLWLGYAEFSLDQGWDEDRRRQLYESALSVAGLHFTDGHKLWAAYRAFELSQLETAAKAAGGGTKDKAATTAVTKAEETVRALLRRQLVVPHAQMEETMAMAEEWERARPGNTGGASVPLPAEIAGAHAKAAAAAAARRPHEDAVAAAVAAPAGDVAAALSKAYRAYIALEMTSKDPSRAQCVFERAVTSAPTDPALWRRYTSYLDNTLKVRTLSVAAHARAVRNCPTHGDTWAAAMRAAEQRAAAAAAATAAAHDDDPTAELMEAALGAGLVAGDDYLAVFTARLDVLRRGGDGAGFRATAQLARETLSVGENHCPLP
jgi:hypothetical protein